MSPEGSHSEPVELDPKLGLGEFLVVMQVFSTKSQEELALDFDVTQQTVSRWIKGTSIPTRGSRLRIQSIFGLEAEQVYRMIENNKPGWDEGLEFNVQSQGRRKLETTQQTDQVDYADRMIGAFAVRAEHGPPLNEIEADLVRFLIERTIEQTTPTE